MEVKNIKTVKVVAERIGKSKKESIIVDGKVYIKSCNVGLWNYLVVCERNKFSYPDNELDGRHTHVCTKHRDKGNAQQGVETVKADLAYCLKRWGNDYQPKTKIIKITRPNSIATGA